MGSTSTSEAGNECLGSCHFAPQANPWRRAEWNRKRWVQSAKEGGSSKSTCWRSVPAGWPRGGGRNDRRQMLQDLSGDPRVLDDAIMRIAPSQRGQAKASMPHARRKSVAHASPGDSPAHNNQGAWMRAVSSGPERSRRGVGTAPVHSRSKFSISSIDEWTRTLIDRRHAGHDSRIACFVRSNSSSPPGSLSLIGGALQSRREASLSLWSSKPIIAGTFIRK